MTGDPSTTHATQLRDHWWWRPGWNPDRRFYTWHLTFDGQHQLHQLVATYQDALSTVPGLDLIPREWLHLTMQGVGFTDEVSTDDARAIADSAATRLATVPPVELTFHRPVIRPEAIALPPAPRDSLTTVRDTVRDGIADVWGADSVPETANQFDPHLSIAYSNTDGSTTAALDAVTHATPKPALITITEVRLIALRRDQHSYLWHTFARARLGEASDLDSGIML